VSAAQPETFSPKNLVVLGGLLAIALFLGEIVVGPSHDGDMAARVGDTLEDIAMRLKPVVTLDDIRSGKSASGGGASMAVACERPRYAGLFGGRRRRCDAPAWWFSAG